MINLYYCNQLLTLAIKLFHDMLPSERNKLALDSLPFSCSEHTNGKDDMSIFQSHLQ